MRSFISAVLFSVVVSTAVVVSLDARALAQGSELTASELVERARRAQDLGRLNEAIDAYSRAYQLTGDSNLLFSLAESHREAGHDQDALRTYQTYLRRDPSGVHRDAAENQVRALEQKIKRGGTQSKVVPPAVVAPRAVTPVAPATTKAPLSPPPASAPRPSPAPIAAPTPVAPAPAPAPATTELAPPPVTQQTPGVDLTEKAQPPAAPAGNEPPLPRWVPWSAAVVTVALATGAIVSGMSASSKYDELKGSCGQTAAGCETAQVDEVRSRARRANILWVLTSVAAVGTGITVYVNTHEAGAGGLWSF